MRVLQGDGVCRTFLHDSRMLIYDQYNQDIFPMDRLAQERIDCNVPLGHGSIESEYLAALKDRLPVFLDSVTRGGNVNLTFALPVANPHYLTGNAENPS